MKKDYSGLLLLGGLGILGYILYKSGVFNQLSGGGSLEGGGSIPLDPWLITPTTTNKQFYAPLSPTQTQIIPGGAFGYTTKNSYVITQTEPTTTVVKKTGSNLTTYQYKTPTAPTYQKSGTPVIGQITVGTSAQQIQQYSSGAKIVKTGGISRKVM